MSDGDQTRSKIIAAAVDLFSRLGPSKVGLRRVAQQADVSLGLIAYHFQSKQGLLESSLELLEKPLLKLEQPYLERARTDPDLGLVLAEAYRRAFEVARQHRPLMRVILTLVGHQGALPRVWRNSALSSFLDRWTEVISERTGVQPSVVRFRLHNILALTTRYVAASEAELQTVFGAELRIEEARDRVAEQLAAMANSWLAEQAS